MSLLSFFDYFLLKLSCIPSLLPFDNISVWFNSVPWLHVYIYFSIFVEVIEQYLNYRQLKRYNETKRPKMIEAIITEEEYLKSNIYNKDKMKFTIFSSIITNILSLSMVWFYAGPYFWMLSAHLCNTNNEYIQSLVYIGLNMLVGLITSIPFSLYFDFVIEERHGFNKKTLFLFFKDKIISIFVQIVLGGPLICAVIALVKWGGETFYFYLWLFTVFISFLMMLIYPNLIAPLFNKFEALKDEELKHKIENLAGDLSFPLVKIYQIDGSKRSAHSNAYFYGVWWAKQIVLYDTLLHLPHINILAILGHELGHWKLRHTVRMMIVSFVHMFVIFYLYGTVMHNDALFHSFGYNDGSKAVVIGLLLFCNIFQPVSSILDMIITMISRRHEFEADKFAHELNLNEALQSGLIDIHKENKSTLDPDPWYSWYHYSHPPLMERLNALQKLKKQKSL